MTGLLRADFRKLTHRWMPRILILILLGLDALILFAISHVVRFQPDLVLPDTLVVALALAAGFAPFIWPILAGSWSGGEYSWGTIRASLSRRPGRISFTLSGLIVVLLTVGIALLLVLAVGGIEGWLIGAAVHASVATNPGASATGIIIKLFLATWFVSAFYVVLAYTVGVVMRSVPAGVGIGIGFSVAQSVTQSIFTALGNPWKSVAEHFPDGYSMTLTSKLASELVANGPFGRGSETNATITQSIIGLAIYMAILLAIALAVVKSRDVTV